LSTSILWGKALHKRHIATSRCLCLDWLCASIVHTCSSRAGRQCYIVLDYFSTYRTAR